MEHNLGQFCLVNYEEFKSPSIIKSVVNVKELLLEY